MNDVTSLGRWIALLAIMTCSVVGLSYLDRIETHLQSIDAALHERHPR